MYDIENYYNAKTIKEAAALLKEHPDTRIISGGSDVLIKIREGKMAGTSLVCIRGIKELHGIKKMDSGDIYIGAGTTFSHITNDPVIQECIPVLGEAVDAVKGPHNPKYRYHRREYLQRRGQCRQRSNLVFPECSASYRRRGERKDSSSERFLFGDRDRS